MFLSKKCSIITKIRLFHEISKQKTVNSPFIYVENDYNSPFFFNSLIPVLKALSRVSPSFICTSTFLP